MRAKRKGQALVEFALVLPLLVILLLSFFDVGIHFFSRLSVDKSVHGAIAAALRTGPAAFTRERLAGEIKRRVVGVQIDEADVTVTVEDSTRPGWSFIEVTVSFSKPTIAGMYVTRYHHFVQRVRHRRLLPNEVLGR